MYFFHFSIILVLFSLILDTFIFSESLSFFLSKYIHHVWRKIYSCTLFPLSKTTCSTIDFRQPIIFFSLALLGNFYIFSESWYLSLSKFIYHEWRKTYSCIYFSLSKKFVFFIHFLHWFWQIVFLSNKIGWGNISEYSALFSSKFG
jgi:hypothetical protein